VSGRYPVGCGDCFLAGLVVALERRQTWHQGLARALGTAAANAELAGAGRFDPARADTIALEALGAMTELPMAHSTTWRRAAGG
jgi:fructose-1-phosphate kinase PfkB-like protein